MIRGVIFDFGNVISSFDWAPFHDFVASRTSLSPGEVRLRFSHSDLPRRYERGDVSTDDFIAGAFSLLGSDLPRTDFIEAFNDIFTPIHETRALIRSLASGGRYRLGLLSNTNELHFEGYIRTVDVFPLFDAVTLSYEARSVKPEGAIYADAVGKLGLSPSECVFIDDIPEFAQGARDAGLHGIVYRNHGALLADLRLLGVNG